MPSRIADDLEARVREAEIKSISEDVFDKNGRKAIMLVGPTGVGKSVLLRQIQRRDSSSSVGPIVDANAPTNRGRLGLAAAIIGKRPTGNAQSFINLAAKARLVGALPGVAQDALKCFEDCVSDLDRTQHAVYLDNLNLGTQHSVDWLFRILAAESKVCILGASKGHGNPPPGFIVRPVSMLEPEQMQILSGEWARRLRTPVDQLTAWLKKVAGGNPTLINLAVWALVQVGHRVAFEHHTISNLLLAVAKSTNSRTRQSWLWAITCRHRITARILDLLGERDGTFFENLSQQTFISDCLDEIGGVQIHPLAAGQLRQAFEFGDYALSEVERTLYQGVYPRLMSVELSPSAVMALHLEKLSYMASCDIDAASYELHQALTEYEFGQDFLRAAEITTIIDEIIENRKGDTPIIIKLAAAECQLAEHRADEAWRTLVEIDPTLVNNPNDATTIRYQCDRARCATGPAPRQGASLFDAIDTLLANLGPARATNDRDLIGRILFELGSAMRLVGRNTEALDYYEACVATAVNPRQALRALEEEAQLLRLMQNLGGASLALNRAHSLRFDQQVSGVGVSLYYQANIYRDQDNFSKATALYRNAESALTEIGDDYHLCCLLGDRAWMEFLEGKLELSEASLESARAIADAFGFGRERAEYWHSRYHIFAAREDWTNAYSALDSAYRLAKEFGNIYIQLDCLMHMVQRSVKNRAMPDGELFVHEMNEIERKGAGIIVFRGRALVYLGDGYYANGDNLTAYSYWKEGFTLVARYGNSRSNVELLAEIVAQRLDKFRSMELRLGVNKQWPDDATQADLPHLLQLFRGT